MTTPIENRADWGKHRAVADHVRASGGHFDCAQALGFASTAKPGEKLAEDIGRPCPRCIGIAAAAKKQERAA